MFRYRRRRRRSSRARRWSAPVTTRRSTRAARRATWCSGRPDATASAAAADDAPTAALEAAGPMSGPVGPAWWGVRRALIGAGPDRRSTGAPGAGPLLARRLRYVFPDHWSFLLGEIALYCFVVLVATGVYLTLFFEPSLPSVDLPRQRTPRCRAPRCRDAYGSTVRPVAGRARRPADAPDPPLGGAGVRRRDPAAPDADLLHRARFASPRELNYLIGLTMLVLAILEGFVGYSLPDDLLSGMGLSIAYARRAVGPADRRTARPRWFWDGAVPRRQRVRAPALHRPRAADPGAPRRADRRAPRVDHDPAPHPVSRAAAGPSATSSACRCGRRTRFARPGCSSPSTAVLVAAGRPRADQSDLAVRPVRAGLGTNGAQPDWYLGWLIGALRLMPNWEPTRSGTRSPTRSSAACCFPALTFGLLYAWPWIERALSGDRGGTTCSSARATTPGARPSARPS